MALDTKLVYLVTVFLGVTVKIIVRLEKKYRAQRSIIDVFLKYS